MLEGAQLKTILASHSRFPPATTSKHVLQFGKDWQRSLVARSELFEQPEWCTFQLPDFHARLLKGENLSESQRIRIRARAVTLMETSQPIYLKPTVCHAGDFIYKICPQPDSRPSIQNAYRFSQMVSRKLGMRGYKELQKIAPNRSNIGLAIETDEPDATTDLLMRLLSKQPHWIIENEIPGSRIDGRGCEMRFICMNNPATRRYICHASYAKVAAESQVCNNLGKGGYAISSRDLLQQLGVENPVDVTRILAEISERVVEFANLYESESGHRNSALAVDLVPVIKGNSITFWFLEVNYKTFGFKGLREINPQLAANISRAMQYRF